MRALTRKLLRTIWSTKGQFLAVSVVVMLGITVYLAMSTSYHNMRHTQQVFYRENNFADYFFHVVRAPEQVLGRIEAVPGVVKATGRIQMDAPIIKAGHQRATARLVSYPLPMDREVNRLQLLDGRLFDRHPRGGGIEVLVDPSYLAANQLRFNEAVTIVVEGRLVPLTIVGTAVSPEFTYPVKDAATMVPDPETFGIVMLPHYQAQQILGLPGQINQVVLQLAPGADEEQVAAQVESLLEPYGNLAGYPREQQLSHLFLEAELDSLRTLAIFIPAVFLGVSAGIMFLLLGRMVRAQRLQIGIMKALGYNTRQIITHYTGYALLVGLLGAVLGTLCGLWLASIFAQVYADFFSLPEIIAKIHSTSIATGFLLSLGVAAAAGLIAARGISGFSPAAAMGPEPPKSGGKILIEHWSWLWARLDSTWKLGLRAVSRNRGRFAITVVGVVFAVGMLVMALAMDDLVDYLMQRHFHLEQRHDYRVHFTTPLRESALLELARVDGVLKTEPLLQVPVEIAFAGRTEDELLVGLPPGATMRKLFDPAGRPMPVPEAGLLVNERTAAKLGVQVGDQVTVKTLLGQGPTHYTAFTIAGINRQPVGGGAHLSLAQANWALRESGLVSGAMLQVDPGRTQLVETQIGEMTGVAVIASREQEVAAINEVLGMMVYSVSAMIGFAVALGFAVVYNTGVISFAERQKELATLRVVGFTSREVSGLLLKETILQSVLGVLLGLPCGYLLILGILATAEGDLFTMPVIIQPETYFLAALGGIGFILAAHRFAAKGIRQLDLVGVLKSRD